MSLNVMLTSIAKGLFGGLVVGTSLIGATRWYTFQPETPNSWKHQLKYCVGWNNIMVQHYDNRDGQNVLGARCIVCGTITDGDEHPNHREPADNARSRFLHRVWAERHGPKDHDLYLTQYKTPVFQEKVSALMRQHGYDNPHSPGVDN